MAQVFRWIERRAGGARTSAPRCVRRRATPHAGCDAPGCYTYRCRSTGNTHAGSPGYDSHADTIASARPRASRARAAVHIHGRPDNADCSCGLAVAHPLTGTDSDHRPAACLDAHEHSGARFHGNACSDAVPVHDPSRPRPDRPGATV